MEETNVELYQNIIQVYKETTSVNETAMKLGTYPIKVRRVLITEGLWQSKTSQQIGILYAKGMSVPEIAEHLFMSKKNVQSYLPYSRGQYGGENRSNDAIRSDVYRERMLLAESSQVKNLNQSKSHYIDDVNESEKIQMKSFNILRERTLQLAGERRVPYAIKLHLELDFEDYQLDNEEIRLLQEYGKMTDGISRDIIVPGDITLHALHYIINRAFGWQNSHLHSFHPYEEDFNRMIGSGKLYEWDKLAGMYFRYPNDDFEDIYWDDDYKAGISIKSWMRKKYTGPYYYGGTREYFYRCQQDVEELYEWLPSKISGGSEVTLRELGEKIYFEGGFDELIERLPIYDLLLMPGIEQSADSWNSANKKALKICEKEALILAPITSPCLHAIRYWYDYGDNWNVKISAVACYETEELYEASGNPIEPLQFYRPVCVAADALSLCDDVGGINGYCDMLKVLHGEDQDEKRSMKEWASAMGWTGRKTSPMNLL